MAHSYTAQGYSKTKLFKKSTLGIDIFLFLGLLIVLFIGINFVATSHRPIDQPLQISLTGFSIIQYAALSLCRMAIAYSISLIFSFFYAKLIVKSVITQNIFLPLLDILQSIPVLSFMPGLVLGLAVLFPHSTLGLEIAAVLLIFTSQVWNITFGFYQTLITTPTELKEMSSIAHFGGWLRATRLEIPEGMTSIIFNSMMSWAGGWFFLMASEQFTLGNRSFQLPGIGSYLQLAASKGDVKAILIGLGVLITMIILLDQLLWRPLIAWADKFKQEQDVSSAPPQSWFLNLLKKSRLLQSVHTHILTPLVHTIDTLGIKLTQKQKVKLIQKKVLPIRKEIIEAIFAVLIACVALFSIFIIFSLFRSLSIQNIHMIGFGALATIIRTALALILSLAWTVPVGVMIGRNPRLAQKLQPLIQVAASIPATAVFPILLIFFLLIPGGLSTAAVILMLLGTQWYMLFNVIAGTTTIPNDLLEATTIYKVTGFAKWRYLLLPAIFPYLVTGLITATGGAWNASIVAEYITFKGSVHQTVGLGSTIAHAANTGNFSLLIASTFCMAIIVFIINKFAWQRLSALAESRFHFE